ncbi:MAG: hypothetical protein NUW22_05055 [Acidobacteria bacterium]|nr:hypothetical protein [Acidobacteriota bacterium]
MRHISFALTTDQVRTQTKTVTRRLGWKTLKPGTLLQPVVKSQGLKKGETVERIGGPIRVIDVVVERLNGGVSQSDVWREGFPQMSPEQFIDMFCHHNKCERTAEITRIHFEYMEARP